MIHSELVIFTSNLAQAIGVLVLAMVLVAFHRLYRRPYLLTWSWSWWAFCVSLLGGSVSLFLVNSLPPEAPARLIASSAALLGVYWQTAFLLFGTFEVVRNRPLHPDSLLVTVTASAATCSGGSAARPEEQGLVKDWSPGGGLGGVANTPRQIRRLQVASHPSSVPCSQAQSP
jgi:uncharacterized membrane protein YfcA